MPLDLLFVNHTVVTKDQGDVRQAEATSCLIYSLTTHTWAKAWINDKILKSIQGQSNNSYPRYKVMGPDNICEYVNENMIEYRSEEQTVFVFAGRQVIMTVQSEENVKRIQWVVS